MRIELKYFSELECSNKLLLLLLIVRIMIVDGIILRHTDTHHYRENTCCDSIELGDVTQAFQHTNVDNVRPPITSVTRTEIWNFFQVGLVVGGKLV